VSFAEQVIKDVGRGQQPGKVEEEGGERTCGKNRARKISQKKAGEQRLMALARSNIYEGGPGSTTIERSPRKTQRSEGESRLYSRTHGGSKRDFSLHIGKLRIFWGRALSREGAACKSAASLCALWT